MKVRAIKIGKEELTEIIQRLAQDQKLGTDIPFPFVTSDLPSIELSGFSLVKHEFDAESKIQESGYETELYS